MLFLQMLLALAVVCLGAVLVLRFVIPRLSWSKKWQKGDHFELISRFQLGPKHTLYLVRIDEKFMVLGGSEQGLNVVCETGSPLEKNEKGN